MQSAVHRIADGKKKISCTVAIIVLASSMAGCREYLNCVQSSDHAVGVSLIYPAPLVTGDPVIEALALRIRRDTEIRIC